MDKLFKRVDVVNDRTEAHLDAFAARQQGDIEAAEFFNSMAQTAEHELAMITGVWPSQDLRELPGELHPDEHPGNVED
jgi:hypothetical protein